MIAVLIVCSLILQYVHGQAVSAICKDSGTAGSFEVIFKYNREGTTTATGLESYTASEKPNFVTKVTGAGCTTTALTNDIYTITYTVNTATALPCGVQQNTSDTSVYHFAISPTGVANVYTFDCDTDDLQIPTVVENNNFYTGHLTAQLQQIQPTGNVKFQVISADGYNAPVGEVQLGQPIKLRLIYDNGLFDRKPNMCGMSFHLSRTTASTVDIEILTKGLGTRVTITGNIPASPIDITKVVKRGSPVVVTIPDDYNPSGTSTSWDVSASGIRINAQDEPICVKVIETDPFAIHTVFPDHFLGTSYRAVDYMENGTSATELFLTAIEDGTVATLDLSGYTIAGLSIDGAPAIASTSVSLDALDTLKITCDDCSKILITSTKKVALVLSDSLPSYSSYSTNQIPDAKYLDKEFIILPNYGDPFMLLSTATTTGTGTYSTSSLNSVALTDEESFFSTHERLSVDVPVYAFQMFDIGYSSCVPSIFLNPGRRQWSTHYDFYVGNYRTIVLVVCRPADIGNNIYIRSATSDELLLSPIWTKSAIPALGNHPAEESLRYFEFSFRTSGHYVIYTKDVTRPFFLVLVDMVQPTNITYCINYLPFGTTFTETNPCTPSTSPDLPGNKLDEDCDTFNDEELQDGIDNDGDGRVDEDLALAEQFGPTGIIVDSLIISDNSAFTGANVHVIHQDGCNIISVGTDSHQTIGSFSKNNDLNSVFDELWVMDTPMFRAYRYKTPDVYYRVTFEFCFADLAVCEESCIPGRKRRSSDATLQHADFKLTVNNTRFSDTEDKKTWRCTAAKIYWIPHVILLLIILIEVVTTAYFLYVKYKLKRD